MRIAVVVLAFVHTMVERQVFRHIMAVKPVERSRVLAFELVFSQNKVIFAKTQYYIELWRHSHSTAPC